MLGGADLQSASPGSSHRVAHPSSTTRQQSSRITPRATDHPPALHRGGAEISPTAGSLAARRGIRAVQPVATTDPQAAFGAVVVQSGTDRPNIAKTALEARACGSARRAARRASAGVVAAGSSGRPAPLVAAAAERSGRPPNARPLRAAHNMPFGGSRAAGTRVPAGADRICAASTVLLERAAAIASLPGVSAACAVELRGRRERRSGLHQLHVLLCVVARQHVAAAEPAVSAQLGARRSRGPHPAERSPTGAAIFGVWGARWPAA